jgi:KDO2-lipid IV(A) lauroyltransferase
VGSAGLRATYWAYRGLGEAIVRVPEPLSRAVARAIVEVMATTRRSKREVVEGNLRRVLASTGGGAGGAAGRGAGPGAGPDGRLLRRLGREAFREYARYWVDGALLPSVDEADVARRMTVESGLEHLHRGMAAGRGVVLALPHVGSWEWGGSYLNQLGYPMTSVAERLEPPALYGWLVEQRRAMGLTTLPPDGKASGRLLRTLREGGLVGLLCDRDVFGNGVEVGFFGERTTMPGGPATLALRTGATLLAAVVYSGPGPSHTAVISPPFDTERHGSLRSDVVRLTQAVACQFEEYIRRAPAQWHVFSPNWPSDRPGEPGEGR